MKTRIIHTNFWKDNYVSSLNPKEKLVFIYLLSNDSVNICGIYQLPDKYIKAELDLTASEFEQIKEKFIKDGKFYFKDGWIKIINYEKYNSYSGEMNEKAKDRELQYVPKELIEYQYSIDSVSIDYQAPADSLNNHKSEIRNHKSEEKGVVKGKKQMLEELDDGDFAEISQKYQVPIAFVRSKHDDLINWHGKNPQKNYYKNYYRGLCDWVKRDALKIIERGKPNAREAVDATNI